METNQLYLTLQAILITLIIIYIALNYSIIDIILIIIIFIIILPISHDCKKKENYINTTRFYDDSIYGNENCDTNDKTTENLNPNTMDAKTFVKKYAKTNLYTRRHPMGIKPNVYQYGWNEFNRGITRDNLHKKWEKHSHEKNIRQMNRYMRYGR